MLEYKKNSTLTDPTTINIWILGRYLASKMWQNWTE